MAFDHAKFLARFVEEAKDHCARLNDGLLKLESSADDGEMLNALFRSAHTIKGSSRMMKLAGITELAHRLEDVLDAIRGGKVAVSAPISDLLFKGLDNLSAMLDEVAAGRKTPDAPESLCEALSLAATGATPVAAATAEQTASVEATAMAKTAAESTANAVSPTEQSSPPPPICPSADVGSAPQLQPTCEQSSASKNKISEYLRVNAAKLDDLIKLMGEIVSEHGKFKSQLARLRKLELQAGRSADQVRPEDEQPGSTSSSWRELHHELRVIHDSFHLQEHLVADLQHIALNLRMQPLSAIFDPLRRTVRDLARERGREVDFVVEGGETELDRKIIERIGDSLTHMIRNALDHGLESPAERAAANKPARGTVRLIADYDSAGVCITLHDDGKGIAVEKIREKVLSKRLYDQETLAGMSRAEIINLIFLPGFSTSPIITDLSGRGVGMDVVRKNIVDELRGSVIVESKEGQGTSIVLRLPLNLAVFSLFLVVLKGRIFALPATSLVEMLTVRQEDLIEIVNNRAIRLRSQLIPVEDLAEILKFTGIVRADTGENDLVARNQEKDRQDELTLVIVQDGEEKLGLIVDQIIGREEMVVKPLPAHLQGLRLLSGLTIGERDQIINVLHVPELIRRVRETMAQTSRPLQAEAERRYSILVVDDSLNTRELEKSILEAYGYQVDTAEDGQNALDITREIHYDLVITDVEMPRLDGFSLTEALRADPRYRDVPIIIVTSREKEEDKRRGIRVGANAYIIKGSFDQSNLLDTVRSLIG